jgi:phosphoribosylamine--glycine ligase
MNVLLIGGGGREHALAMSIALSPLLTTLYAAPGNPGIANLAKCLTCDVADHDAVINLCRDKKIELVVIGPEAPLVEGLVDSLTQSGILSFGPSKMAAKLEGSKEFARDFCDRHNIPQPGYAPFDDTAAATGYVKSRYQGGGCVVKADGLAAGKGVTVADNEAEAIAAIRMILDDGKFGTSGATLVIEDRIEGTEASLFALTDGRTALKVGSAQDHKRAFDGDRGPNTGGMGAISPAPALTADLEEQAWQEIILPVINGMREEGNPYKGFLYTGLMLTATGPQVIEFNCRFGDPEAEVILPRLKTDLLALMVDAAKDALAEQVLSFDNNVAITVIMANGGYPGPYEKGAVITGLDQVTDVTVFHAGTTAKNDTITATGGRVLAVTALGRDRDDARTKAYEAVETISWPGCFCRSDIAAAKA